MSESEPYWTVTIHWRRGYPDRDVSETIKLPAPDEATAAARAVRESAASGRRSVEQVEVEPREETP